MPELLFATIKSILVSVPYGTLWSIMWRLVSEKQTESIFEMWIQYTRCVTSYNNINNMSRSLDIYLCIIVYGEFTRHICIYICIYRVHSTYKYIRVSCLGMNVVWVTIYHRSDWGEYQEYWHISISRTRHMNTIRSYVEFTWHLHIYLCMSSSLDIRLCRVIDYTCFSRYKNNLGLTVLSVLSARKAVNLSSSTTSDWDIIFYRWVVWRTRWAWILNMTRTHWEPEH